MTAYSSYSVVTWVEKHITIVTLSILCLSITACGGSDLNQIHALACKENPTMDDANKSTALKQEYLRQHLSLGESLDIQTGKPATTDEGKAYLKALDKSTCK